MSKKTHLKVVGVDCRDQGQSEEMYNTQALCGFAGVTVTRKENEVDCKLCIARIEDDKNIDDLSNYGGGH